MKACWELAIVPDGSTLAASEITVSVEVAPSVVLWLVRCVTSFDWVKPNRFPRVHRCRKIVRTESCFQPLIHRGFSTVVTTFLRFIWTQTIGEIHRSMRRRGITSFPAPSLTFRLLVRNDYRIRNRNSQE